MKTWVTHKEKKGIRKKVHGGNIVGFVNLHKYMVITTSKSLVQIARKPLDSIKYVPTLTEIKKRWCSRRFFEKLMLNSKLNLLKMQNGLKYRSVSA
jgi:hypothetical protein